MAIRCLSSIFGSIKLNQVLMVISIICLVLVFKTSDEAPIFRGELFDWFFSQFSIGNAILFNLASGLLISIWFYFLVVYLPDVKRQKRIKKHFVMQYLVFREQVITHILGSCGESYNSDLLNKLTNPHEFKVYFDEKVTYGQTRWQVFISNADSVVVQRILSEFIAFKEATLYLLSKVDIEDEEVHAFLHHFNSITITLIDTPVDDYDSMKKFSGYLREIFAGFSWSSGSRDYDYFAKMLEKL
jgi:hypothetical protein